MNTENALNSVKFLIAEYEDEKRLRVIYQTALEKIEYMQQDEHARMISIARVALNGE